MILDNKGNLENEMNLENKLNLENNQKCNSCYRKQMLKYVRRNRNI
jgi:hypothetical protein